FLDLKPETTDEADLYWPLNHVEVRLQTEPGRMTRELGLVLKTITPNFDRFEVSIDQSSPFSYRSSYLNWSLKPGINRLDVRSVNQLGVKGPVSSLELRWAPGCEEGSSPPCIAGSPNANAVLDMPRSEPRPRPYSRKLIEQDRRRGGRESFENTAR